MNMSTIPMEEGNHVFADADDDYDLNATDNMNNHANEELGVVTGMYEINDNVHICIRA